MTDVEEMLESMQSAVAARPMPAFDDVVRRHRRAARRRLAWGSVPLVVAAAAGAGAYLAPPGTPSSPATPRLSAAATAGTDAQPVPALAGGVCRTVAVTQPADTRGRPDPVSAAAQFARDSGDGYPTDGWQVVDRAGDTAQVETGAFDALVLRGTDGTWRVVSAQRCD